MVTVAAYPWTDAGGLIAAALLTDEAFGAWSVYDGPAPSVKTPAVLIRPDDPFIVPASFDYLTERYLALALVAPADPPSANRSLYRVGRLIIAAVAGADAWSFQEMTAPRIYDNAGITAMGLAVAFTVKRPAPTLIGE